MSQRWQVSNTGNAHPANPLEVQVAIPPGFEPVEVKLFITPERYREDVPAGIFVFGEPPENLRLAVNDIDVTEMHGGPFSGETQVDVTTLMLLSGAVNVIKVVPPSPGRIHAMVFVHVRPITHDS